MARDKRKSRVRVIEKTDTLTVLQAPVAFVVNLKEVAGPESAGDRLAKQEPWVIPIEKYRPSIAVGDHADIGKTLISLSKNFVSVIAFLLSLINYNRCIFLSCFAQEILTA